MDDPLRELLQHLGVLVTVQVQRAADRDPIAFPHTVSERLDINAFLHACRVATKLATGTE